MQNNIHYDNILFHFWGGIKNVSDKFVEKIPTHILCSIFFFPRKSCLLRDIVEKY